MKELGFSDMRNINYLRENSNKIISDGFGKVSNVRIREC